MSWGYIMLNFQLDEILCFDGGFPRRTVYSASFILSYVGPKPNFQIYAGKDMFIIVGIQ